MNQVQKPKEPTCPTGCERIDSQEALGQRLLCSRVEAGRKIVFGKLRAAHAEGSATFYRSEDLNRLRAGPVDAVANGFARLSAGEKADLLARWAALQTEFAAIQKMAHALKAAADAKK